MLARFRNASARKTLCLRLSNAPRDLHVEFSGAVSDDDIVAKLEGRIIDFAKVVVMAKDETNRITGKIDKSFVQAPAFKYEQATRLAAVHMLNPNTGSFKNWADEAKADLNT